MNKKEIEPERHMVGYLIKKEFLDDIYFPILEDQFLRALNKLKKHVKSEKQVIIVEMNVKKFE